MPNAEEEDKTYETIYKFEGRIELHCNHYDSSIQIATYINNTIRLIYMLHFTYLKPSIFNVGVFSD